LDAQNNTITIAKNITFGNNVTDHWISDNQTCVLIKGRTSVLEIC